MKLVTALALFFAFWGVDGLNSYLNFATGRVLLYQPHNVLRLAAGMLNGASLSLLVWPMFNYALWETPGNQQVITGWGELAAIMVQIAALAGLLLSGADALLYLFVLLELAGVVAMLTIVNSMIVLLALRRENLAQNWRQAVPTLSTGLLLSMAEAGGMAAVRYLFASAFLPPVF
jgi:hypothetical protein